MVDLGGIGDKAKNLANSEQAEKASDIGLEKAADAAESKTGGKFDDKIESAQTSADRKVGNE